MQIGLCTISNQDASVDAVIRQAGETGYDGVEVWGKDHVDNGDPETCRSIRETAREADIEIPVYSSYLRVGSPDFGETVERELEIARRLDADLIRVWAGSQEYGNHDEAHWEQAVADLERTSRLAADRGIDVTVEKHANTLTNDGEGARRLLEAVDRENCWLNWQPTFSMEPDELVETARNLAPLSNNVHVQAVPKRGSRDRCPLEDAFFDLEELLGIFEDASFSGFVNVEFVADDRPYRRAIETDLEYLRRMS
ncbi:sugar phosphate isomerase/epimerase family protein [Natrialba aegyptia]|uniref:Putative AP endonuclease, family 2 protein n=1 Tax=Natrialba aegyptia DSM 13077 TaxID=1227491 RepID=M0AIZ9_9EURY|nr:sugar phosphate isomerase/epimerase family protein [Natrialba aegyptia]ELY98351.1 putative AP endonuclease, family 2 protein [Natrialba aegyptia DSM 13077]